MKIERNLRHSKAISCANTPPWYNQLIKLDEGKRKIAYEVAMDMIKVAKPKAYNFIKSAKCELIGFIPNVAYTMPDNSEGSLDVTFIHDFSQKTLLFWCSEGEFCFFVNPSMKYNDGVRGLTY